MENKFIIDGESVSGKILFQGNGNNSRLKSWQAYAFAAAVTAATLGLRLALAGQLEGRPTLVVFILPIMLSAYVGGLRAGLLATLLCYLGTSYYLLPPFSNFRVASVVDRWDVFFLMLAGVVISGLNEALNRARHRADLATRERAEEDRQRFFALSQDVLCILGFDGYFKDLNPAWEKTLGYTKTELLITPFIEFIHPDDRQATLAEAEKVSGGKALIAFENRYRCKDGSYRWFQWSVTPVIADQVMYGVARDVTERRREEAASILLAAIVNASDDAIISKDLNGIITSWNKGAKKIFGYTAGEMRGTSIMRLIPADREEEENQILGKIKLGESVEHFETLRRTKDGRLIDISVTASPITDSTGKVTGVSKVARDITERKLAEAAVQESEARFRTMSNSMPQLAWIASADGSIFWYNQRWYEYTGTTLEQMEGCGWQSVHDPEVLPKVIEGWKAAIGTQLPFEMEFPLRGADGQFRVFLTRVQPLNSSAGQVVQWFGTNTDVQALKQSEAKVQRLNAELEQRVIERTAQLEAANQELEAFSYSVSHDLRAPLRAVNGFAGIVLEDFGSQLPEEGRRYLERIRNGGQQMGMLIDDLLAFSRLSRQLINLQRVDTTKLAQNAIEELKPQRDGRRIEIKVGELPACQGDPALLKQVWVNLISNAVKYTCGRELAIVEIGCTRENGENVYFVRDNGAGFDMQYANKLFGVFQRLHRADEFEGTGVGLAIVQRIIYRHGGRVWAEAKVNQGATFYFTVEKGNTP